MKEREGTKYIALSERETDICTIRPSLRRNGRPQPRIDHSENEETTKQFDPL